MSSDKIVSRHRPSNSSTFEVRIGSNVINIATAYFVKKTSPVLAEILILNLITRQTTGISDGRDARYFPNG